MDKKNTVVEICDQSLPGNLDFWNTVEQTDPNFTKGVSYGSHSFTAIDAYYQIKNATAVWGQYGLHWGLLNTEYALIPDTPLMQLFAEFTYPFVENGQTKHVSFPISTAIQIINKKGAYDADFAKKVETSLICKSLSRLGFNADVFLGKFDDNIYKEQMVEKFTMPDGQVMSIEHTEEDEEKFHALLNESNALDFYVLLKKLPVGASVSLNKTFKKGEIVSQKAKAAKLESRGKEEFEQYLAQMVERIVANDDVGLIELGEEVGRDAKELLFSWLSSENQQLAKEIFQNRDQSE